MEQLERQLKDLQLIQATGKVIIIITCRVCVCARACMHLCVHMCAIGVSVQIHHTFHWNTVICGLGKYQQNDNVSKQNVHI